MSAARLDTLNASQRVRFARALYIRRARLPRWAALRVVINVKAKGGAR